MRAEFSRDGSFSLMIDSVQLSKGLRPSKRSPRNSGYLVECSGAIGKDDVLQVIDQLTNINTTPSEVIGTDNLNYTCIAPHTSADITKPITGADWATVWIQKGSAGIVWATGTAYKDGINDGFPYPQLFVLTNMIIVCGQTGIFEWDGAKVVRKLTVTAGSTFSATDFSDYVYMSNGTVSVIRDAATKTYSITTALPVAGAICNYNGQIIIGSPRSN